MKAAFDLLDADGAALNMKGTEQGLPPCRVGSFNIYVRLPHFNAIPML